ncbi:hypothetical protein AMTRI_Chr06g196380 [Amborella trichopoda]
MSKGTRAFRKGSRVEVGSDEDGFKGAWFTATVTKMVGKFRVTVEYDNLMSDDEKGPLVETVEVLNVRPLPPSDTPRAFSLYEEVDAFHNDGWWVGVITKVIAEGPTYIVYFRNSGEEMLFELNELRVHQDFVDGHWVLASSQKLLLEEQFNKNEESIPPSNNYNRSLENREKDPSIEPEMEPLVEALPLDEPELKNCGSNIRKAKKLSPLSSVPLKGPEESEEEKDDCIVTKAIFDPVKASRRRGRSSQMDMLVKTPTKEGAQRAQRGEDNGNTSMVAPSSEENPSQNSAVEIREFDERKADGVMCRGAKGVKKAKKGVDNGSICMVSPCSEENASQNSRIRIVKKLSLSPSSSIPQKGCKEPEEEKNDNATYDPKKPSRKHGRRSELDISVKTPTKEGANKAKMGRDNGNKGMLTPSSEANPSLNSKKAKTKAKEFEETKTDSIKYHGVKKAKKGKDNGSSPCLEVNPSQKSKKAKIKTEDLGAKKTKCAEIYVSIPHMRVSTRARTGTDDLAMLAGTCKDMSLATYYLVLQTLYIQGDHTWGNEIFLAGLRAALAISNDEHMEELKRVTSNKFITS